MVSRILDASAFYAGVPFGSMEKYFTTMQIFDEISHIKEKHGAIDVLFQTGRLDVRQASKESLKIARDAATESGDIQTLSDSDVSLLALGYEMKGEIITDDYAISNVAKRLNVSILSVMTRGIIDTGRWIRYCSGCAKEFSTEKSCPQCGNPLRKKLVKRKA
ncbi:MAG: nucleotide-binding protein [Cenarchaeum symbiont of Oopsacas minuta]|nr:nucleotide-binding protein [Cenarchaeum symbiont of Oopsacas minuta]